MLKSLRNKFFPKKEEEKLSEPEKGIKVIYCPPSPITARTEERTRKCPLVDGLDVFLESCRNCQFNQNGCKAPVSPKEF